MQSVTETAVDPDVPVPPDVPDVPVVVLLHAMLPVTAATTKTWEIRIGRSLGRFPGRRNPGPLFLVARL